MLAILAKELRANTRGYPAAGVGPRIRETEPTQPESMAAELLSAVPAEAGVRVHIGHSAGAHTARATARCDELAVALVLIDPNLGSSGRYDPLEFNPPVQISGWDERDRHLPRGRCTRGSRGA